MAQQGLIYKGNGFYVGVPARDLTPEEVKKYGEAFLLSLGLFEQPQPKRTRKLAQPDEAEESED
jgi:hypothetical protein